MPLSAEFKAPFQQHQFYHIVFKSVDGIFLFRNSTDKMIFLQRIQKFACGFVSLLAYNLLDNHTHIIAEIKNKSEIIGYLNQLPEEEKTIAIKKYLDSLEDESILDEMLERQINRLMVSYANTYNNKYKRKGAVFQSPFRRIAISGDVHLQQAIIYVHANEQKHNLTDDFKKSGFTSWRQITGNSTGLVDNEKVLNFFGGMDKFIQLHDEQVEHFYTRNWPSSKLE